MNAQLHVALYRAFDPIGRLLYVGVSRDPGVRVKIHVGQRALWTRGGIGEVTEEWYSNRCDALLAERRATLTENPIFPTAVLYPRGYASAVGGLRGDLKRAGLPMADAPRLVEESGYLDNANMTPRSEPLDVSDDGSYALLCSAMGAAS